MIGRRGTPEDQHGRFMTWLADGARGLPPRDVAVHAAYCDGCRRATAAFDALTLADPGRAPMPPSRGAQLLRRSVPVLVGRLASGAVAVLLVAGGGAVAASNLLPRPDAVALASRTPDQAVLGGRSSAQETPLESATAPPASADPGTPTATAAASTPAASPSQDAGDPAPPTTAPSSGPIRTATPAPTSASTPRATGTATPSQFATASSPPPASPTATATPTPTPTPVSTTTPTPVPTATPTPPPTPADTPTPAASATASP